MVFEGWTTDIPLSASQNTPVFNRISFDRPRPARREGHRVLDTNESRLDKDISRKFLGMVNSVGRSGQAGIYFNFWP